ncbi:A1S_2505 family phage non-structural protein [Coleofasciculus sp. G2-EDA-02]|uniref:A1S_2505 family phage non-structural protein n=1 Tax=Coleofasciculus sp. G2-EDA-02 TaxID=3069529 RepID=UPI0040639E6C
MNKLSPHQIPVWGSNVGYHGAGVALQMFGESYKRQLDTLFRRRGFGLQPGERFKGLRAVYGQGKGYHRGNEGDSYAIETKSDWKRQRSTSLAEIGQQIDELIEFAKGNPQLEFLCTPFGTGRAGYSHVEIARLWKGKDIPDNMRLPSKWLRELINSSGVPSSNMSNIADCESMGYNQCLPSKGFIPKNVPHASENRYKKVTNLVVSDTPVVLGDARERQSNNRIKISHAKFKEQKHLNKQTQLFPPVNIYSKSPDWLGASLTNPTTVAEYWASKRQSGIKDKFPVFFSGKFWKDAEEAYQYFKQDVPLGSKREKLMASILEAKLNQYPELITEIDKRGGRLWLETCEHRVNGGFWEGKGTDSLFISALSKAYERASLRLRQKEADSTMTVAFSGSRAKYFKECPNLEKRAKNSLRDMVKTAFDTAFSLNYDRLTFVTGMATGIDQWGAIEAMRLRQQQRQGLLKATPQIEVLASVPCMGQERVWNQKDKDRYFKLLSLTDDVHLVSREFYKSPAQLFKRNDDMLNRLTGKDDMLLVVQVAGSRGTQEAINKALSQGKELLLYEPDKKGTQEQRYTYFAKETERSTPPSPELVARLMAMKKEQIAVEQVQFKHSPNFQEVEL